MKKIISTICMLTMGALWAGPGAGLISQLKPYAQVNETQANVRTDLRQMTNDIMAPPIDQAARLVYQTDLLAGMEAATDRNIKSDLIRELGLCGTSAALTPLGAYLTQPDYYAEAAMAIEQICMTEDCADGLTAMRAALASSPPDKILLMLMQMAGDLRDGDASTVDILLANAGKSDWDLKLTALRSLANIGDPRARNALAAALTTDNAYYKSQIIAYTLLYSRRLAAQGLKADATALAQGIKDLGDGSANLGGSEGNKHVITAAEFALAEIPNIVVKVDGKARKQAPGNLEFQVLPGKGLNILIHALGACEISISDARGRQVWFGKTQGEQLSVPKGLFSAGIYLVEVKAGSVHMAETVTFR